MPDFHNVTTWICSSNKEWQTECPGSNGAMHKVSFGPMLPSHPVQYDWMCSCQAYQFGKGKYCKHILAVKDQRCGWNAELEPTAQALAQDGGRVCPKCKGPAEPVVVAV